MVQQNLSESEEMYVITLARLAERGVQGPVPLSQLAEELAVLPVSANQMVHKLQGEGILDYQPYKGVALRPAGWQRANRTLRRRRLWELFLVEQLGLGFAEADTLACRFEHLGDEGLTERLAEFLGNPQQSPRGLPIPPAEDSAPEETTLSQAEAGREYTVVRIGSPALAEFLAKQSIAVDARLRLSARSGRGAVLLQAGEVRLDLAADAAAEIFVIESK